MRSARMDLASVYVTCPDEATAKRIARALLERKLVACANLFPIASLYVWEGALREDPEVAMLLKTRRSIVQAVIAAVEELHPYDVPCAVAFEVGAAAAGYAAWVEDASRHGPPS